jgi:putative hydrolase of the HAD superfamily
MGNSQKTVIWDFDGTLAERPGLWSGTMAEALRERFPGSGIIRDDIRPYMKNVFPWDTPDIPHPELSAAGAWWAHMESAMANAYEAAGIEKEKAARLAALAHKRYVDPGGFILYDDTVPALERLSRSGWRHIILSNHVPELPGIVAALGIGGFFSYCISSANTGWEKPNPQAFKTALDECGRPDAVWMIGDSVRADIEGAQRMGIPAVLVHTPDPGNIKYHADALKDVIPILESD